MDTSSKKLTEKRNNYFLDNCGDTLFKSSELLNRAFETGIKYKEEHSWFDAHGDYLPEYEREVIVLCDNSKVCFGHRPNPDGYIDSDGKEYKAKCYGKGGWNGPDVKLWLDLEVPDIPYD